MWHCFNFQIVFVICSKIQPYYRPGSLPRHRNIAHGTWRIMRSPAPNDMPRAYSICARCANVSVTADHVVWKQGPTRPPIFWIGDYRPYQLERYLNNTRHTRHMQSVRNMLQLLPNISSTLYHIGKHASHAIYYNVSYLLQCILLNTIFHKFTHPLVSYHHPTYCCLCHHLPTELSIVSILMPTKPSRFRFNPSHLNPTPIHPCHNHKGPKKQSHPDCAQYRLA